MKTRPPIEFRAPHSTFHVSRITRRPSRITHHASLIAAFTLIELLIVIAIIALLAAMIMPVTGLVSQAKIRSRAKVELNQVAIAIEGYKSKLGYYPPDNPGRPDLNQLYYELLGVTNDTVRNVFNTLDGSALTIPVASVSTIFGPGVAGFINATKGSAGDEGGAASVFLRSVKPGQYLGITQSGSPPPTVTILGSTLEGPFMWNDGSTHRINPWRYNHSSPTNNPRTYDLWIDVMIGKKTNRIANWSDRPIVL